MTKMIHQIPGSIWDDKVPIIVETGKLIVVAIPLIILACSQKYVTVRLLYLGILNPHQPNRVSRTRLYLRSLSWYRHEIWGTGDKIGVGNWAIAALSHGWSSIPHGVNSHRDAHTSVTLAKTRRSYYMRSSDGISCAGTPTSLIDRTQV